jgi:hypothetical protein
VPASSVVIRSAAAAMPRCCAEMALAIASTTSLARATCASSCPRRSATACAIVRLVSALCRPWSITSAVSRAASAERWASTS